MCAAASGKERCNVELGVFVLVDLVPKCILTVYLTLGGCSEAAVATSNKASQCLEVGESRRQEEVGERERDR